MTSLSWLRSPATQSCIDVVSRGAFSPAAVLFDVDGTLAVGSNTHLHVLAEVALAELGVQVEFDVSTEAPHMNGVDISGWIDAQIWRELLARAGSAGDATELQRLVARHGERFAQWLAVGGRAGSPVPGAFEAIAALRAKGVPLALVTGNAHRVAEAKLRYLGLADPFEFHPDGGFGDWRANRSALPSAALVRLGATPADVQTAVLVGDTVLDMISARDAGVIGIGVMTGANDEDELLRAGARFVLSSVAVLPGIWHR